MIKNCIVYISIIVLLVLIFLLGYDIGRATNIDTTINCHKVVILSVNR